MLFLESGTEEAMKLNACINCGTLHGGLVGSRCLRCIDLSPSKAFIDLTGEGIDLSSSRVDIDLTGENTAASSSRVIIDLTGENTATTPGDVPRSVSLPVAGAEGRVSISTVSSHESDLLRGSP